MNTQQTSTPNSSDAGALRLYPSLALIGKAGAGKDTVAEVLRELYPVYHRVAFADKLKDVAADIWGESARTDRDKLQKLGVAVREIDPDAWVTAALGIGNQLRTADGGPIVVTDVRFPNEVRACIRYGLVTVRIIADRGTRLNRLRSNGKLQDEAQLDHISETALDGYTADYSVLNMDTREELGERLGSIVEYERSQRG